jgi:hypothetical protein
VRSDTGAGSFSKFVVRSGVSLLLGRRGASFASAVRFPGPEATIPPTLTDLACSMTFLDAVLRLGAYDRVRVATKINSTAAGSSNSATTRMNHRRTVSLSAPSSIAR